MGGRVDVRGKGSKVVGWSGGGEGDVERRVGKEGKMERRGQREGNAGLRRARG